MAGTVRLTFGFPGILGVIDISDCIRSFNALAANYKYSRSKKENLPLTIQMQLSQNFETFC